MKRAHLAHLRTIGLATAAVLLVSGPAVAQTSTEAPAQTGTDTSTSSVSPSTPLSELTVSDLVNAWPEVQSQFPGLSVDVSPNVGVDANVGLSNTDANVGANISPGVSIGGDQTVTSGVQSGQTSADVNSSSTMTQGSTSTQTSGTATQPSRTASSSDSGGAASPPTTSSADTTTVNPKPRGSTGPTVERKRARSSDAEGSPPTFPAHIGAGLQAGPIFFAIEAAIVTNPTMPAQL